MCDTFIPLLNKMVSNIWGIEGTDFPQWIQNVA